MTVRTRRAAFALAAFALTGGAILGMGTGAQAATTSHVPMHVPAQRHNEMGINVGLDLGCYQDDCCDEPDDDCCDEPDGYYCDDCDD